MKRQQAFYMSQTYCVAEIPTGAVVSSDFATSFTDVTAQDSSLLHYNHDLLPPLFVGYLLNAGHITHVAPFLIVIPSPPSVFVLIAMSLRQNVLTLISMSNINTWVKDLRGSLKWVTSGWVGLFMPLVLMV